MPDRTDIIYTYDGSFEGLLCCVFESYERKEIPSDIRPLSSQQTLFDTAKWIEMDECKAERVYNSIPLKISSKAQELVKLGFLTCVPHKELLLYHFLRLGFKYGSKVMTMITDDTVNTLLKAVRNLTSESHQLKGFVRFSVFGQVLVAIIEPKNYVLPLLSHHFCDRFCNETFMIYDRTHSMALIYQSQKAEIIFVDELTLPEVDSTEVEYRRLWRKFYKTIAIEGRYNPRCLMNHMPKRFWGQLTEIDEKNVLPEKDTNTMQFSNEDDVVQNHTTYYQVQKNSNNEKPALWQVAEIANDSPRTSVKSLDTSSLKRIP